MPIIIQNLKEQFRKKCLEIGSLNDISIYCRLKKEEGTQYWFHFLTSTYSKTYNNLCISIYKNYTKVDDIVQKISNFGSFYHIIYTLFLTFLKDKINTNKPTSILISIVSSKDININNDTFEYLLDKNNKFGFNNEECPVCNCSWLLKNPVILPDCNHRLCADCLLGIVRTSRNEFKCPVCRTAFV